MPPLELSVQGTPNPNAIKITLNRTVAAQGTTYRAPAEMAPPWAQQLLAIPGVTQVFAINSFISVTKRSDAAWDVLGPQVEQAVKTAFH